MFEIFITLLWWLVCIIVGFAILCALILGVYIVVAFIGYVVTMSKNHGKMRENDDGTL